MIHMEVFQEKCERVEKLQKQHSNTLNSNKVNSYSNLNFSGLINYKLLKHALAKTGASKSIIVVKNVPTNLLRHKEPSDILQNTSRSKVITSYEVELEFKLSKFCTTKKYIFFCSR